MESVLGRYRNLTILVGVLFLQVLGLAVQVKRSADAENTRLIRVWAVGAITPFERGLVWLQNGGNNLLHDYLLLRGVRAENRELKGQIEKMTLEQARLTEEATQAERLQSLLAFKELVKIDTVAAQVIGSSGSDLSRSIYINKGENAGLKPDMAVITAGGIVGKVWLVYPSTSLVLMINDQSSGVGVFLEKSRLQGVLRGTPNGELVLERVMSDEQVVPGEAVLSSGGDQIFPKGLPVGTVSKVGPGRDLFLNINVKPAADLSRLEEVLVVTQKEEREPVAQSGASVRAADILARRLPSVPDKPVAVAGAAAVGNTGAKPQPNDAAKPAAAKLVAKPASGSAAVGSATGGAQPASGEPLKKVAQKPASGDSATRSEAGSAAVSGTADNTSGVNSNSANSPAKPAAAQPKSSSPQPAPPPAATEDNPH
ncbi:MAG: rod shape-determining protein MreC [Candidatus Sulfotelmatobacter sp.]